MNGESCCDSRCRRAPNINLAGRRQGRSSGRHSRNGSIVRAARPCERMGARGSFTRRDWPTRESAVAHSHPDRPPSQRPGEPIQDFPQPSCLARPEGRCTWLRHGFRVSVRPSCDRRCIACSYEDWIRLHNALCLVSAAAAMLARASRDTPCQDVAP